MKSSDVEATKPYLELCQTSYFNLITEEEAL